MMYTKAIEQHKISSKEVARSRQPRIDTRQQRILRGPPGNLYNYCNYSKTNVVQYIIGIAVNLQSLRT